MSALIDTPGPIWLVVPPVDMRRGIDGLSADVQRLLGQTPCAGAAFVLRNRSATRLKVLIWDGQGVWLCQRRLHQGRFVWPRVGETALTVSLAEWQWLIAGVDWRRLAQRPRPDWQP